MATLDSFSNIEAYSNQVEIPGIASIIHEDVLNQATYGNHCELSATTILAVYNDVTNSKGMVRIGTRVSDYCIEWGIAVQFYNGLVKHIIPVRVSDTKFMLAYAHAGDDDGYCIAGTVAGTVPTLGSEAEFADATTCTLIGAVLMTTDKVMIVYQDATTNQKAVMASMSGTVVTIGTSATINSTIDSAAYTTLTQLCMHSATLASVVYRVSATVTEVVTLSLSGTTITVNTAGKAAFGGSADVRCPSICAMDATKFALAYTDATDTNKGNAQIGTISTTTITAGASEYTFDGDTNASRVPAVTAMTSNYFAIIARKSTEGALVYIREVSGTVITARSNVTLDFASSNWPTFYPSLVGPRITYTKAGQLTFSGTNPYYGYFCGMVRMVNPSVIEIMPMLVKVAEADANEQIEISSVFFNAKCSSVTPDYLFGQHAQAIIAKNGTTPQKYMYNNGEGDIFTPTGYGDTSGERGTRGSIIIPLANNPILLTANETLYVGITLYSTFGAGTCHVNGLKRS